jgi:Mrp family chromosome partitioning ATPase/capsular polysaccharide biosynthesis protein
VVKRRKWVVLPPIVLIPAAVFFFSLSQTSNYSATAQVLLNRQDVVSAAAQVPNPMSAVDAERLAATQADIASSPLLARKVVAAAAIPGLSEGDFERNSSASASSVADVLSFSVTNHSPRRAAFLATIFAQQYTVLRRDLDTSALKDAIRNVQAKIDDLGASGALSTSTQLLTELLATKTRLETAAALQTDNALVIRPATGAAKIAPRPAHDALLGLLFGVVLGLALAFLWEALDSRVHSAEEVENRLGFPLLGTMPKPSGRLRRAEQVVMCAEPESAAAEAVRQLRTNIELAITGRLRPGSILVTSALPQEGKSTVAANLAVAFCLSGWRVILVDLDLRNPRQLRFFIKPRPEHVPGITDAAEGRLTLDEVLVPVTCRQATTPRGFEPHDSQVVRFELPEYSTPSRNGRRNASGSLHLLPAGTIRHGLGDFVVDTALGEVLAEASQRVDLVLIDAPPMLSAGDAAALSAYVDALLVVFRLGVTRRPALVALGRQLEKCPATTLGFVATGAVGPTPYGVDQERYVGGEAPVMSERAPV